MGFFGQRASRGEVILSRPSGGSLNRAVRRRHRYPSVVVAAAFATLGLMLVPVLASIEPSTTAFADPPPVSICPDASSTLLGPNVCIFNTSMTQTTIQNDINAIAAQQVPVTAQFDSQRYAIFFEPGTYGSPSDPLVFQVGYYTEVAGLGAAPADTVIDGAIDAFNNLCTAGTNNCNSSVNFWRSLSNLTLNVDLPSSPPAYVPSVVDPFGAGCDNSAEFWSASQASPIRRAIINGSVVFQDYCANNNYVQGGLIADSKVSGNLNFFGNQEYVVRNSDLGGTNGCPNGLWDLVYSGVVGAPAPVFTGTCQQNTVLSTSPVTEEEPFLYTDSSGNWQVFVPAVEHGTSGPSWARGTEAGTSIPIGQFFVANPATPLAQINAALAKKKDLILTPGVYNLSGAIVAPHPDTVIIGLGFATLVPQDGNAALDVVSNSGVKVSGLIVDAGPVTSPVLVSVGTPANDRASATDPDLVSDVFFRIGGAETTPVSAAVSLLVNADNSIIDDVWAWRADHGNNVGWTANSGATGVDVTGDNVTAYGLAVEHYQKYEVVWSGQGGTDVFFQNELPYDPPSQSDWMATPTQDGYPAFFVTPNVTTFNGYGMGSYVVFLQTTATVFDQEAFEAPDTPGVQFHNIFTVWITGSGGDNSIINGAGGPDTSSSPGAVEPLDIVSYP